MYQSNIYEYLETLNEEKLLICNDDKEAIQVRDVAVLLGFDTFVLPDLRVAVGEDLRAYAEDVQLLFLQLASFHQSTEKKYLSLHYEPCLFLFLNQSIFPYKL